MTEQEPQDPFDERLQTLAAVQEALARRGFAYFPIEKEHTEGLVTGPLLHRVRTQIKKRGFSNVASRAIFTFSGYAADPREIYAISEVRAYWQRLDAELPELPALLAYLPELRFNGPGQHLLLLGRIDTVLSRPTVGMYDVHVTDAPRLLDDATRRIRQAGRKYHLDQTTVANLVSHFLQGGHFLE
jgi:hypothetical protein